MSHETKHSSMESKWNTSRHWWAMNLHCNDLHFCSYVAFNCARLQISFNPIKRLIPPQFPSVLAKCRTSQWDLSAEGRGLLHTSCALCSCSLFGGLCHWTTLLSNRRKGDSVMPTWTVISCHWDQPGDCELPIEDAGLKDLRKGLLHIDHISPLKSVFNRSWTFVNASNCCICVSDFVGESGKPYPKLWKRLNTPVLYSGGTADALTFCTTWEIFAIHHRSFLRSLLWFLNDIVVGFSWQLLCTYSCLSQSVTGTQKTIQS